MSHCSRWTLCLFLIRRHFMLLVLLEVSCISFEGSFCVHRSSSSSSLVSKEHLQQVCKEEEEEEKPPWRHSTKNPQRRGRRLCACDGSCFLSGGGGGGWVTRLEIRSEHPVEKEERRRYREIFHNGKALKLVLYAYYMYLGQCKIPFSRNLTIKIFFFVFWECRKFPIARQIHDACRLTISVFFLSRSSEINYVLSVLPQSGVCTIERKTADIQAKEFSSSSLVSSLFMKAVSFPFCYKKGFPDYFILFDQWLAFCTGEKGEGEKQGPAAGEEKRTTLIFPH